MRPVFNPVPLMALLLGFHGAFPMAGEESARLIVTHPGAGREATRMIQSALDSGSREIVLEGGEGEWITGPLFVRRDNVRITLTPGTVVRGKAGAFPGKEDALLSVEKRRGFTLIAHGAELVMPGGEFNEGEHRHCLNLRSVSGVRVHGGTYARSGGDGIYLGVRDARRTNDDIVITDIVSRGNRRQGMSVTCASRLLLRDCLFLGNRGTPPEAGLDFEPNHADDVFTDCVVSHCLAIDNAAQGFENHFNRLRATSRPLDLLFEHCYAEGGAKYGFTVLASDPRATPPPGTLTLRHCVARHNGTAGIRTRNGASGGLRAVVEDGLILRPGTTDRRAPLWFLAQDGTSSPHGDAAFIRLRIVDGESRAPVLVSLQGSAATHGLGSFTGDITVMGPEPRPLEPPTADRLPGLSITPVATPLASLDLRAPAPGTVHRRGAALLPLVFPELPDGTAGWTLHWEVRHQAKVIHSHEGPADRPLPAWTPPADRPPGLHSLWFTLRDDSGRIHDLAASAVLLD